MASLFAERVGETIPDAFTGSGTYDLGGALSGFRTFVAGIGNANVATYFAMSSNGLVWEHGYGTVTDAATDTLSRNLLASSTGSLINWTGTGRKIFCIPSANLTESWLKVNAATARPGWLPSPAMWVDTSGGATAYVLYFYDGTDNIQLATINTTANSVSFPGTSLNITGLTAETSPATDDEVPVYDLSATANRKFTWANILKVINSLTEDTTPDVAADFSLSYDTSASAVKKVKLSNFNDINSLTTTDNPASSAFVAGSTGAGTNRKFRVGEVGGWCVLEEQTASASSQLDFAFDAYTADFDEFDLVFDNILPTTDAVDGWLRFSTDGGSTFDAGASDYAWITSGGQLSTGQTTGDAADNQILLNVPTHDISNVSGEGLSGNIRVINPAAAARTRVVGTLFFTTDAGNPAINHVGGHRLTAQDTTNVRFLFSSGTIASGKITLIGRRKVT